MIAMKDRQIITLNERNRKNIVEMGLARESSDGKLIGISNTTNMAMEHYLAMLKRQRVRF
jgi:hypothetical protein